MSLSNRLRLALGKYPLISDIISKDLSPTLAKAAPHARWVAILATLIVVMITPNYLTSAKWSTILTAAGTLVGLYGVWFTLEIFRIGERFSQQQIALTDEVRRSVMTGLKVQHGHELRRKYEDAKDRKDDQSRIYWNFVWRFETFDYLGLALVEPKGYIRIQIVGSNNPAMETNSEKFELPIYTVKILEVIENTELKIGVAYCTCINGRSYISNTANEKDLYSPQFEFTISGIGAIHASTVGDKPKNFKRLKDLKDPTSGDTEQVQP